MEAEKIDIPAYHQQKLRYCDMVVVFLLMLEPAALEILAGAGLRPERIATADEALLEPVALFSTVDLGDWSFFGLLVGQLTNWCGFAMCYLRRVKKWIDKT